MTPHDKHDHEGKEIQGTELPDKEILVWVISPVLGGDADEAWIRDYGRAVEYAQEVIAQRVDDADQVDLLEHGVTVKMKLRRTTVQEYQEVYENEV